MADLSNPQRLPLWRRLLLLFILEGIAALGIVIVLQIQNGLPHLALILLSSTLLGLVSGLGVRLLLHELHWTFSSLATMAALFSGLFILGAASSWQYGLGPQEFKAFDMAGATHVATGLLASLLAATGWRRPANQVQEPASIPPSQLPQAGMPALAESNPQVIPQKSKPAAGTQSKSRKRPTSHPVHPKSDQAQKASPPPPKYRQKRRARRPEVQFASTQEHRCPYCLEIVQPQDPRGIIECKICHTLHHADCWAITGTCQVPHLNA